MVAGRLQAKKGHWYMVLQIPNEMGKPKSKWIATHLPEKGNKKRAEAMLIEVRRQYTEQKRFRDRTKGIFFDEYLAQWLASMKGKLSPTTFRGYSNCVLNSVCPFFHVRDTTLSELRPADIEAYYEHLRMRGVSNNTIIHHHANIRKALQDAVRKDLIPYNPADRVERPKKEQYAVNCYTAEEANRLIQAVKGDKLELAVTLSLFYGLRRSEVLGLRWGAIDFLNDTVSIHHSVNESTVDSTYSLVARDKMKRQSSFRTLPLTEPIKRLLLGIATKRYGEGKPENEAYLCVDEMGRLLKPNYVSEAFPKLLQKHGLRQIRFHDLRHPYVKSTTQIIIDCFWGLEVSKVHYLQI